jgi:hypothetical protein
MAALPVMGPAGIQGSYTSTRPPSFGNPHSESYSSYRRDVELWLELTEIPMKKQGVALVGCLVGEPKAFAKTLSNDLLFSENSGKNVLIHLDKAYLDSAEMILNTRVSNLIEYQRLPTMSISTYVAGFYARLDNLTQLQMPDELKGHLLLNQANFGSGEKSMIVASAKGSFKIAALVDSMRQLYGDRQDIPIESPSFVTAQGEKRFCNYCKKKNHVEKDCWKKKKAQKELNVTSSSMSRNSREKSTYVTFLSTQTETPVQSALIDTGAVHTIIGKSTLDNMMKSLNIGKIEKCQPLQVVHRFGTHGVPIEPEFGVIIPWTANDTQGNAHSFNFRADVLDGNHPFLVGCPTLMAMKSTLIFENLTLKATINDVACSLPVKKRGNHIFIDHAPVNSAVLQTHIEEQENGENYYGCQDLGWKQYFLLPDHC